MKKTLSLLVALAAVVSVGTTAFAADDYTGTATPGAMAGRLSPRISGNPTTYDIGIDELYLIDQDTNAAGGLYERLQPDEEYTYDIYWNNSGGVINSIGGGIQLTGADLAPKGTIRLRTIKGSSNIQSARIVTVGRGTTAHYELNIKTRANYGTKINEVEYSLAVTGDTGANAFKDSSNFFEVGYSSIDDSDTDIGEGGYITISNDAPVITKSQFTDIAKSVNYKTVNFEAEDGGWLFNGRVSGMGDTNFYYSYDVIPDLINKFPYQEYKFLTFNAGVTFPASGEMRIDASDISGVFDELYLYLYRNGKLTRIDATHDAGTDELVFRTNYLGAFVVTDKKITSTSLVDEEDNEYEDIDQAPAGGGNSGNNNNSGNNPSTGTASAGLAVTLALASLAAGLASRKKKR